MLKETIERYQELEKELNELQPLDSINYFDKTLSAKIILNLQNQNFFLKEMSSVAGLEEASLSKIKANLEWIMSIKDLKKALR